MNAPLPTFTSSTNASTPSASFLHMMDDAISGMDSTVAVTSRREYRRPSAGASSPPRSARRAESSQARPGSPRSRSRSATINERRRARCSSGRRSPEPRRPPSILNPGVGSGKSSAKPTRSLTTCAMCFATPVSLGNRLARTRRAIDRTPPRVSVSAALRRSSRNWSRPRLTRSRPARAVPSFAS